MAGPKHSHGSGKRRPRAFLGVLCRHLPELRRRYRASSLGIFGSYVSGAPRKGSDLDMLVDFIQETSLFEFMELEAYLSAIIGVKVDLVMRNTLKPRIGYQILSEVINL
jgi:predicted nucleotidyltransferase